MFDTLSDKDVSDALDDLSGTLGFKEEAHAGTLLSLMRKKETQKCVQEIAAWLGLPVQIDLSYVSKDFRPGDSNRFQSEQLSRTDWTGRGIEGITAQVAIPQHLPMYGTRALEGYRIRVRVSENCHDRPTTFIAIMAHELSHVLLHSLLHPHKDSELHTDLVPMLLGFCEIVGRGRKVVEVSTKGNTTTQRTTTYGYLTDSQFEFVRKKVETALADYEREKNRLLHQTAQMRRKLQRAKRRFARFRRYLQHIDSHPNVAMKGAHGSKLVECHALGYTRDWEGAIDQVQSALQRIELFVRPLNHCTSAAVERLGEDARSLSLTSERLDQLVGAITSDLRVLRRYVGPIRKLWIFLRLR